MHVHYIHLTVTSCFGYLTTPNIPLYTSPSSFSSSSMSMALSGETLGDRLIYLPRISPSSPSGLADRDGERETNLPSELADEAEEDRLFRRRSGEDPREEGGVRDGVLERARVGLSSSSWVSILQTVSDQDAVEGNEITKPMLVASRTLIEEADRGEGIDAYQ